MGILGGIGKLESPNLSAVFHDHPLHMSVVSENCQALFRTLQYLKTDTLRGRCCISNSILTCYESMHSQQGRRWGGDAKFSGDACTLVMPADDSPPPPTHTPIYREH